MNKLKKSDFAVKLIVGVLFWITIIITGEISEKVYASNINGGTFVFTDVDYSAPDGWTFSSIKVEIDPNGACTITMSPDSEGPVIVYKGIMGSTKDGVYRGGLYGYRDNGSLDQYYLYDIVLPDNYVAIDNNEVKDEWIFSDGSFHIFYEEEEDRAKLSITITGVNKWTYSEPRYGNDGGIVTGGSRQLYMTMEGYYDHPTSGGHSEQSETVIADSNPGEQEGGKINPDVFDDKKNSDTNTGVIKDTEKQSNSKEDIVSSNNDYNPWAIKAGAAIGTAAVGAGAAVMSGKRKKKANNKPSSSYQMNLYKDFGGVLKRGDKPRYIYARIVEVRADGVQIDRPDLTAKIHAGTGSSCLTVTDRGMSGSWKAAELYIPNESTTEKKAVVTFRYINPNGASYTKNVEFRVVGDARILYPDGTHYKEDEQINVLMGDNKTYEVVFTLVDFAREATTVRPTRCPEGYHITVERLGIVEGTGDYDYKLVIHNQTEKNVNKPLQMKQKQYILFEAFNTDEKAEASLEVDLYPEGISLEVINRNDAVKDDQLLIHTLGDETASGMDYTILPTVVQFTCAYADEDDKVIITHDGINVNECFDPETGHTNVLLDRWKYEIKDQNHNDAIYAIVPKETLALKNEPPTKVIWHIVSHQNIRAFIADISITLTGDEIDAKKHEGRERELVLLKRAIGRYGFVGDIADDMEKSVQAVYADPTVGASQIKQLRANLVLAAILYYQEESGKEENRAKWLSVGYYSAATVDWVGQQAFSYVIKAFAGDLSEMLITPFKNYVVNSLAEIMHDWIWGLPQKEHITWKNTIKVIEEMCENFIIDAIFGDLTFDDMKGAGKAFWEKVKKTDYRKINLNSIKGTMAKMFGLDMEDCLKKATCFIIAFSMLNFTKHYWADEEDKAHGDIGLSIIATMNDCTITAFKQIFSKYVTSWLGKVFNVKSTTGGNEREITIQQKITDFIKAHISFEGIELGEFHISRGSWLNEKELDIFKKKYNLFPKKDDIDVLINQGVDGATGAMTDGVQALMGIMVSYDETQGFLISMGKGIWRLSIMDVGGLLYDSMNNIYNFSIAALKNNIPIPDWIIPKSSEEVKKDMDYIEHMSSEMSRDRNFTDF